MRRPLRVRTSISIVALVLVALALPRAASAAVCTWTGGGASNNWSAAANWSGCNATFPQPNDDLIFPAGALRPSPSNDTLNLAINSIQITGNAIGNVHYTINGSAIVIDTSITFSAGPDGLGLGAVINAPITLAAATSVTNSGATTVHMGAIVLGGNQLVFSAGPGGQLTIDGVISGAGLVQKLGDGELFLMTANTFTGFLQAFAGTVIAFNQNALGASGPGNGTFIDNGAALRLHNPGGPYVLPESMTLDGPGTASLTDGALYQNDSTITVSGSIVLAGFVVVRTLPAATLTLSGNISGGVGTLSKQGTGTLILTGNNTHLVTDHEDGNLFINGNQPTVETNVIAFGDFLGGTGTTGETSAGTGVISPGLTVTASGILNIGTFLLGATGNYDVQLNGVTPGAGYDQLNVSGSVTLSGDLVGTVGFAPANGQQFIIINNDGGDPVVGTLSGLAEGALFVLGGQPFSISYVGGSGNDVVLTYNPLIVPTMPTVILIVLAIGLMTIVMVRLRPRAVA